MRKFESFDIPSEVMKLPIVHEGRKANRQGRFVTLVYPNTVGVPPLHYRNLMPLRYDNQPLDNIVVNSLRPEKLKTVYDSETIQAKDHYRAALSERNQAKVVSAISASFGAAAVTFAGMGIVKGYPSLYQQYCEVAKAQTVIDVGCPPTHYRQNSHDLKVDASLNVLGAVLLGAAMAATLKVKDKMLHNVKINFVKAVLALNNIELCKEFMTGKIDPNGRGQAPS